MFYSRFNRGLAATIWLLCAGACVAIITAGLGNAGEFLPLVILVAWLAWAGLWLPSLQLGDDEVTIRNVFMTTAVPWATLIQVDTRYALTLVTPHGRYAVTAAPAPGRLATALSHRDMSGIGAPTGSDGGVRPSDLPNTDSGAAAHLVRARWETLLAEDRIELGRADDTPVVRRVNWPVVAISATLFIGSVLALALG
ncbi:MAG: PH domain-containing protein [Terrimesophilobacter sp.]